MISQIEDVSRECNNVAQWPILVSNAKSIKTEYKIQGHSNEMCHISSV